MFETIRRDFDLHNRSLRNRAFWALLVYRYGTWSLHRRSGWSRWLAGAIYEWLKVLSEILTRIRISRRAVLGGDIRIVHAGPLHIDAGVVIGDRCKIMHGTTIGACVTDDTPVIGDDVFIATGVSILGNVTIGDRAKIFANSLVIEDVPQDAVVVGVPAKAFADPSVFKTARKQQADPKAGDDEQREDAANVRQHQA